MLTRPIIVCASINSPSLAACARQHSVSTAYWNTIRNSIPGFATPTPTVLQKSSWPLPRLLGFELAPRIKDIKDQTLYKIDRQQHYANLDPILTGTIRMHLIRQAWDEVVRVIASIHERIVSASLILHRLGSYARQNSIHQALAEIGRVHRDR
jgi:hypothetical protein